MGVIRWLKRLLGTNRVVPLDSFPKFVLAQPVGMSAADVLDVTGTLQKANAQWPAIWEALNPDGDAETQRLLIELRGPYLFAPHVALNVLVVGCKHVLAGDSGAGRVEALRSAMVADNRVVRPT